jgi:hypothetical protein
LKGADRPVDRLLTTREVAAMLALSTESVLRRWRVGELPGRSSSVIAPQSVSLTWHPVASWYLIRKTTPWRPAY